MYRHGRLTSSCTFILSGKVAMVTDEAAVRLAQVSPKRSVMAPVPSSPPAHQLAPITSLDTSSIVELEPWTAIATAALIDVDGHFIPDFTAYLLSSTVKLLILNIHSPEACAIDGLDKRKRELGIYSHRGPQMHLSRALSFRDSYDGFEQPTTPCLPTLAVLNDDPGANETAPPPAESTDPSPIVHL